MGSSPTKTSVTITNDTDHKFYYKLFTRKGRRLQEENKLFIPVGQKIGPVFKSCKKTLRLSGAYRIVKESKGVEYTELKEVGDIELVMPDNPGEVKDFKLSELTKEILQEVEKEQMNELRRQIVEAITTGKSGFENLPKDREKKLER